jgi:hypothetical protein
MEKALHIALEALEKISVGGDPRRADLAISVIKAALEAKNEPVAWFWFDERDGGEWVHIADNQINADKFGNAKVIPLYTTPPQRTWVELDEEDYIEAYELCDFDKDAAFKFFETKLKEKNETT